MTDKEELRRELENRLAKTLVEKGFSELLKKYDFPEAMENVVRRKKQSRLSPYMIGRIQARHLEDTLDLSLKPIYTDWRVGDVFVYIFRVKKSPPRVSREPPKNPETIMDRINRAQERAKKGDTYYPTINPDKEFEVLVYYDMWFIIEVEPFQPHGLKTLKSKG